nr:hypothetical protein [Gordonia terrae]
MWLETGPSTRKARNLARDPRCTLSVALDDADLVVDGHAPDHRTRRRRRTRRAVVE